MNGLFYERLTKDNCAMIMIDHQTGTMLSVQDIKLSDFRSNVLALAETAKIHDLPTVLTASFVEGPNGPLMEELTAMFPDAPTIYRPGPISAWDDPNFVQAVEATKRQKLIMSGVTIDICLMLPALQAKAAGYDVYAVYDCSGCWDQMSQTMACMRLVQAGIKVVNWVAITAELQADWRRPTAQGTLDVFHQHLPFYNFLTNNQNAVKNGIPGLNGPQSQSKSDSKQVASATN